MSVLILTIVEKVHDPPLTFLTKRSQLKYNVAWSSPFKGALYRIQILCRRYTFWSYPAGLTIADPPDNKRLSIAESIHTTFTPLSPSLFTPHQILYSAPLTTEEEVQRSAYSLFLRFHGYHALKRLTMINMQRQPFLRFSQRSVAMQRT